MHRQEKALPRCAEGQHSLEAATLALPRLWFSLYSSSYLKAIQKTMSFTLMLGLRHLKAKSVKDASAAPATQAFSWQPVASTMVMLATYSNGNNKTLW